METRWPPSWLEAICHWPSTLWGWNTMVIGHMAQWDLETMYETFGFPHARFVGKRWKTSTQLQRDGWRTCRNNLGATFGSKTASTPTSGAVFSTSAYNHTGVVSHVFDDDSIPYHRTKLIIVDNSSSWWSGGTTRAGTTVLYRKKLNNQKDKFITWQQDSLSTRR